MAEQQSPLEQLQTDQALMHDFSIRMYMLDVDGGEVGELLKKYEAECIPGDFLNLFRLTRLLGQAAVINQEWALSQRIAEIPNFEQQLQDTANLVNTGNSSS